MGRVGVRRGFWGPLVLILLLAGVSQAQEATENVPGTAVALRFRYCPPGELYWGKFLPEKAEPIPGFYLGESEVSVGEFVAILGDDGLEKMRERFREAKLSGDELDRAELTKAENVNLPMVPVGVLDAVAFCKGVNARFQAGDDAARARGDLVELIAVRRVRLPTWWEWQYAARASRIAEDAKTLPHFPKGIATAPVTYKDLDGPSRGNLRDLWETTQGKDFSDEIWNSLPPAVFQQRLLILDNHDKTDRERFSEVLMDYFLRSLGWKHASKNALGRYGLLNDKLSEKNNWGVWGLLDNASEWVLWTEGKKEGEKLDWEQTWVKLDRGNADDLASLKKEGKLFLSGGSHRRGYMIQGDLARRTLWGGPTIKSGEDAPTALVLDASMIKEYQPGFRVLLVRTVRDDWHSLTRPAWIASGKPTPTAREQLARARKKITDLYPDETQRRPHLARLDADEAFVTGNLTALVGQNGATEEDREFLELATGK